MNARTSRSLAALTAQPAAARNVQPARHQRAAHAALEPPLRWPLVPSACPLASRDTDRTRGTKTEGKIKGPARHPLKSQSARGVGAARRPWQQVPCNACMSRVHSLSSVPSAVHCATLRWSVRHGRP
jgi:hypothetical protein